MYINSSVSENNCLLTFFLFILKILCSVPKDGSPDGFQPGHIKDITKVVPVTSLAAGTLKSRSVLSHPLTSLGR